MGRICGLIPKFNLYTVPGQSYYHITRKLVLEGVDGIVFVADSQQERLQDNIDSFEDLRHLLKTMDKNLESIPAILQCNKQDLTSVLSPKTIHHKLAANNLNYFPAQASHGIGVFETLKAIIMKVGQFISA